jgi:hypothetical protein
MKGLLAIVVTAILFTSLAQFAPVARAATSPGQQGYEGQPGNQGGGTNPGLKGYEGKPGNQGGH